MFPQSSHDQELAVCGMGRGREMELGHVAIVSWVPWTGDGKESGQALAEWALGSGEGLSIHRTAPGPANEMLVGGRVVLSPPRCKASQLEPIASFFSLNSSCTLRPGSSFKTQMWSYQVSDWKYFMASAAYNIITKLWVLKGRYDLASP